MVGNSSARKKQTPIDTFVSWSSQALEFPAIIIIVQLIVIESSAIKYSVEKNVYTHNVPLIQTV